MGLKTVVLVAILVVAAIVVPMAQAQLGGLLGGSGGLLGLIFGLIRIEGLLYCTPNGNIGASGSATPVFPNAPVQLRCGGTVISTTMTNGAGAFSILLNPLDFALNAILSGCSVVISTPLATCNTRLPSVGGLQSTLQLAGTSALGPLNVANIAPTGFSFIANLT